MLVKESEKAGNHKDEKTSNPVKRVNERRKRGYVVNAWTSFVLSFFLQALTEHSLRQEKHSSSTKD